MVKGMLMVAVLSIFGTGMVGFRYAGPNEQNFEVQYHVSCEQCNVTFRNEKGVSTEIANVKKAWNYKFVGIPGQFVYLSASNDLGKPVSVMIVRGGQDLIEGSSDEKDQDARAGAILEAAK